LLTLRLVLTYAQLGYHLYKPTSLTRWSWIRRRLWRLCRPRGGGECGPHGAGRGGKTSARYPSFSRLDNCHCNFWIANGEADFSTFSC
jgi:hypothetical protein